MSDSGIHCQKLTVKRATACLRRIQFFTKKWERLPDIVYILLQNVAYGDITSVTRDIQLGRKVWMYQEGCIC